MGASNAFLHIEDPTENIVSNALISKSGRIVMDPSVVSSNSKPSPADTFLFDSKIYLANIDKKENVA